MDDDPLQLEMTAVLCRELGIETESCPFPEYAEKLVQESAFDLVFTDIQMPGVDGFEVLRRIRAVRAELPVVAVSARSDDESAYVERGFAAVLRKPFARAELVAVLRRVVPEAGVAPEECLPEEDAVRGFEALTAFARDDAEAAREIIRTFVAENEAHAETLRRAALAGDAVALRAIAHKMVTRRLRLMRPCWSISVTLTTMVFFLLISICWRSTGCWARRSSLRHCAVWSVRKVLRTGLCAAQRSV